MKGCGLVILEVWPRPSVIGYEAPHPSFYISYSLMNSIQYIDKERRELLKDLQEIICNYQTLKESDPQHYRKTVIREMHDYLRHIKQHPVFSEFCKLTHINQDEFMSDILNRAINTLL